MVAFVFGDSIPMTTTTQAYCDERLAEVATKTTWTTMLMVMVAAVATESAFHIHSLENAVVVAVSATPKFVGRYFYDYSARINGYCCWRLGGMIQAHRPQAA